MNVKSKKDLLANPYFSKGTKKRFKAIIDILLQNKENEKDEISDDEEEITCPSSNSYNYIKIKRIKEVRKKKIKEKYYSSTIIRENADISYENIELLKLIEKNKPLLIYPSRSLEI